jgi:hypothetical protein
MTTTKELIEFLKKFPEDTKICILKAEEIGGDYSRSTDVSFEDLDLTNEDHFEFTDWTDNQFVDKDDRLYKTKILSFGITES